MTALRSLLVIGLLFTAAGFASGYLGDIVGPIDYTGYLVFEYPTGENPITNIVFTVDSKLSSNLIITNVPSPWSNSYSDGVLTLSGGSLSPSGTISVAVSLNKYIKAGEYPVSSVGTTSTGESSHAIGALVVGELFLLNALGILSANRLYLTGGLLGIGFIEWILTKRLLKPVQTYPDKVLTPSDLEEIRDSLPSDLPEGGKIVIDQGMGVTSDGELIQLDEKVKITSSESISEQAGVRARVDNTQQLKEIEKLEKEISKHEAELENVNKELEELKDEVEGDEHLHESIEDSQDGSEWGSATYATKLKREISKKKLRLAELDNLQRYYEVEIKKLKGKIADINKAIEQSIGENLPPT